MIVFTFNINYYRGLFFMEGWYVYIYIYVCAYICVYACERCLLLRFDLSDISASKYVCMHTYHPSIRTAPYDDCDSLHAIMLFVILFWICVYIYICMHVYIYIFFLLAYNSFLLYFLQSYLFFLVIIYLFLGFITGYYSVLLLYLFIIEQNIK